MMERSAWAKKPNQEYILAIKIKRECWEKALRLSVLSSPNKEVYQNTEEWKERFKTAKVRIQWDPERTLRGEKKDERSIQVGIGRELIEEYSKEWIVEINDVTALSKKINALRKLGKYTEAKRLLPVEKVYPLDEDLAKVVGIR